MKTGKVVATTIQMVVEQVMEDGSKNVLYKAEKRNEGALPIVGKHKVLTLAPWYRDGELPLLAELQDGKVQMRGSCYIQLHQTDVYNERRARAEAAKAAAKAAAKGEVPAAAKKISADLAGF